MCETTVSSRWRNRALLIGVRAAAVVEFAACRARRGASRRVPSASERSGFPSAAACRPVAYNDAGGDCVHDSGCSVSDVARWKGPARRTKRVASLRRLGRGCSRERRRAEDGATPLVSCACGRRPSSCGGRPVTTPNRAWAEEAAADWAAGRDKEGAARGAGRASWRL